MKIPYTKSIPVVIKFKENEIDINAIIEKQLEILQTNIKQ